MKAPDKIYIPDEIDMIATNILTACRSGDTAYVRRDALPTWKRASEDMIGDFVVLKKDAGMPGDYVILTRRKVSIGELYIRVQELEKLYTI